MFQRRLVFLIGGLLGVWTIPFASVATAQIGLAQTNDLLRQLRTQSGVEIRLGTDGDVEVKVPERGNRSSSPFGSRGSANHGDAGQANDSSPPPHRSRVTLPAEINQLLGSIAPGIRMGRDGTTIRRDDLRVEAGDGFAVELDTGRGKIVVNRQGVEAYAAAVTAFGRRDYRSALQHADSAVKAMTGMTKFVQFRGLANFANAEFASAADDVYQALRSGPAFDWAEVANFYATPQDYAAHYRELQTAAKAQPDSVELQFLVAYHHMLLGHHEAALAAWQRSERLLPKDPVITAQLRQLQQRPKPMSAEE